MRAVLLILILILVAVIVAIATDLVDISQTRSAEVPEIQTTDDGVRAQGGQAPAFDIETGSISVGAQEQNVTLPMPTVDIDPANEGQAAQPQAPVTNAQ